MDENNNVVVRVPEQQFIRGEDGYSPVVTIEEIEHGHSVNITDREHPEGQSFDVLDGASAYEQAVAGGYTGTEAQFNEDLSNFKTLHDETEEAAPFYAVYGVTTRAQIESAINNKRQIYLLTAPLVESIPQAYVMPLTEKFEYQYTDGDRIVISRGYRFSITSGTNQYIAELANGWAFYTNDLSAPADRAEAAAQQALNRMNSADQSAQSAARSASDASRDAGTASAAATTATTKAGEASDSATAADGSAKDSEAYAIGKRGGTDVGSTDPAYHNNAKYYAEQAASSASDAVTAKGAAETAQGKAEDAQEAAEQAQEAAEAVLESIPSDYTELSDDVDNLKSAKAPVIIDTASGAIASFEDGADGMPIKSLTVNIEPVQSGTGNPSPDNVRPISGWTGCNIHVSRTTTGGTVYPIAFPTEAGTVYGGTLDVTNGVLMVDKVDLHTDLAAGTWTGNGTFWQLAWRSSLPTLASLEIMSDIYKNLTPSSSVTENNIIGFIASGSTLRLRDNSLTTPADVRAKLANIQTIFQLANPISYQLTAQQITTLLGTNNIWADCGPVSVEYPVDTSIAFSDIKNATEYFESLADNGFKYIDCSTFTQGRYGQDGTKVESNVYACIDMVIPTEKQVYVFPASETYDISVYTWDYLDGVYSNFQQTGWITSDTRVEIDSGKAMSIIMRNAGGAGTISAESISYVYYLLTSIGNVLLALDEWTPKKIACVGDSLTAGVIHDSTVIAQNYPYFMGKMLGCSTLNYGVPGADPKEYWHDNISTFTFDSTIDTVLIMLGTNGGIPDTLETDVYPYADYNDYADTFCGCYCKTIMKIIELTQNKAQVILLTPPYTTRSTEQLDRVKEARETILKIGLYYNIPVIDVFAECGMGAYNASIFRPYDGCHFNAKGYHRLGTYIGSKVKSLHSNWDLTD